MPTGRELTHEQRAHILGNVVGSVAVAGASIITGKPPIEGPINVPPASRGGGGGRGGITPPAATPKTSAEMPTASEAPTPAETPNANIPRTSGRTAEGTSKTNSDQANAPTPKSQTAPKVETDPCPTARPSVDTYSVTRSAAFNQAKIANDIPISQQPNQVIKPGTPEGYKAGLDPQRNGNLYGNRSRVIAVFEPKTNVCRKMVEHWLVLPPFLKQNRGFLTP